MTGGLPCPDYTDVGLTGCNYSEPLIVPTLPRGNDNCRVLNSYDRIMMIRQDDKEMQEIIIYKN